jgi:rod shape-determining protein MreD
LYRTKYRSVEIAVGPAYWPTLGWTALLTLIQTAFAPLLTLRGVVPSLSLIAVVLYASRAGARRGAQLAIPTGLLLDIFAGTGGGFTIATTLVALLVGGLSRRMFADGVVAPAFLCGVAILVRDLAFWSVMGIEGFPRGYAGTHLHEALWRALLTAIVAFVWLIVRGRLVTDKTTIERYAS